MVQLRADGQTTRLKRLRVLYDCQRCSHKRLYATAASLSGSQSKNVVLLAAGGTGGHVFPALAVASCLIRLLRTNVSICALGNGTNSIEHSVFAKQQKFDFGPALHAPKVPSVRDSGMLALLLFPARLAIATVRAARFVHNRKPSVCIATGGYVCVPTALACVMMRVPLMLVEPNSVPGKASQLLSPFVNAVVASERARAHLRWLRAAVPATTGTPVRAEALPVQKDEARRRLFATRLHPRDRVVVVVGGSQGALPLNRAIEAAILEEQLSVVGSQTYIVWQHGKSYSPDERLLQYSTVLTSTFFEQMGLLYGAADLVVARSGAVTCAELLASGVPSLLVPFEKAAGFHQHANAMEMEAMGASKVFREAQLYNSELGPQLQSMLRSRSTLAEMSRNALACARHETGRQAARLAAQLAGFEITPVGALPTPAQSPNDAVASLDKSMKLGLSSG